MNQKEFEKQCPLFPAFPNYTKAMYEGNEPCCKGHKLTNGNFADNWACMYGGGEVDGEKILHVEFNLNHKIKIFICGNTLKITDIRYSGKPDVFLYINNGCINKNAHQLETEKIEQILSRNYDCKFWKLVQKRAKELYQLSQ